MENQKQLFTTKQAQSVSGGLLVLAIIGVIAGLIYRRGLLVVIALAGAGAAYMAKRQAGKELEQVSEQLQGTATAQ